MKCLVKSQNLLLPGKMYQYVHPLNNATPPIFQLHTKPFNEPWDFQDHSTINFHAEMSGGYNLIEFGDCFLVTKLKKVIYRRNTYCLKQMWAHILFATECRAGWINVTYKDLVNAPYFKIV